MFILKCRGAISSKLLPCRILVAVSYTHLDVYKRQVLMCSGALVVNAPPNQCNQTDHNGVVNWYPLYARWPSTAPGACIGYYCRAPNDIYVDGYVYQHKRFTKLITKFIR